MPTVADLMGIGMPAAQAGRLGNTPTTLTCTGTTQATAASIPNGVHLFVIASTAAANGAILSTAAALGTPHWFTNGTGAGNATANIYCPVGGTMNTATNGSLLVATGKSAVFIQTAQSTWVSILTA